MKFKVVHIENIFNGGYSSMNNYRKARGESSLFLLIYTICKRFIMKFFLKYYMYFRVRNKCYEELSKQSENLKKNKTEKEQKVIFFFFFMI